MLLIIVITLILAYFIASFYQNVKKLPPGPMPLPIIGNMHEMAYGIAFGGGITNVLKKWAKKYGPVHTMWFGPFHTVNICDWSIAQDAMVKKGAAFANRWVPYNIQYKSRGLGIIFSNDEHWTEQRRFALHSLRNFGLGRGLMEERIMLEVDYRCEELSKKIEKNGGSLVLDPEHFIDILVGNIINRMLFTERFTNEREKKFFEIKATLDTLIKDASILDIMISEKTMFIPFIRNRMQTLMAPQDELIAFFREQVKQRRDEIAVGTHELKGDGEDFVDAFLIQMEKNEKAGEIGSFFDDSLELTLLDLWMAGQETSSTTLYWAFNYLLLNPQNIPILQKELDAVTGGERSLSLNDKSQTPFLNAVITETLRLSSIVPANIWRATASDTVVGDFLIKKGTTVTAQISVIMADQNTFTNPDKFDPSRYLGDNRIDQQVVAFGMGKRACLGESLARAELYLVLGNLASRFSFSSVEGSNLRMEAQSEKGTVRKANNYQMNFRRRLPAQ